MPARRWEPTEAEIEIIRTHSNTAAGERLGKDPSTIRRVRREYGYLNPGKSLEQQDEPVALADAPESDADDEQPTPGVWRLPDDFSPFTSGLWTALERVQDEYEALETERHEITVRIEDTRPVLCAWLSDLHIGHTRVQMKKLREDFEAVRNTDGLFAILGGDLTDNVVTATAGRGMFQEQLTPAEFQRHLMDEALTYLGTDKVLGMVLGNHDEWSLSHDGFNPIKYLAGKLGCPYLGPTGVVNIELGSETYRLLVSHQSRYYSAFNKTHSAKRLEDFETDADATMVGHTHEFAAEWTRRRHQYKFYGQAGTYLRDSRYGKRKGYTDATPEMPGVILWPNQHKVFGIADTFGDGIAILRAFRQGAA